VARIGHGEVVSASGAKLDLSSAASAPGYSPIDLMYAAVAGCLALSARVAASELHVLDQFVEAKVTVTGRKTGEPPRRITHFDIAIQIVGDFDEETRHALIERAEELCTVSNTFRDIPAFVISGR
jgi:uncharacterized OsmC-like protein